MSTNHSTDVSVLIVNWNSECLLRQCLTALQQYAHDTQHEVWVVDNGSSDTSVEMVRRDFPHVHVIANDDNRGFAAANNQALRLARGRYVMLLNPDAMVQRETLSAMVNFLDQHLEAAGVGPRLAYPDGQLQRVGLYRKFPSLLQVLFFYTPLKGLAHRLPSLVERNWEHQNHNALCEVDQPPGAAFMVRRNVVDQIGGLDEGFFLYFEDVDWCYRMRQHGYRLFFFPGATVTHRTEGSTSQLDFVLRRYLFTRSMVRFFHKHHGWAMALVVTALVGLGTIIEIIVVVVTYPFLPAKRSKRRRYLAEIGRLLRGEWSQVLQRGPRSARAFHPTGGALRGDSRRE